MVTEGRRNFLIFHCQKMLQCPVWVFLQHYLSIQGYECFYGYTWYPEVYRRPLPQAVWTYFTALFPTLRTSKFKNLYYTKKKGNDGQLADRWENMPPSRLWECWDWGKKIRIRTWLLNSTLLHSFEPWCFTNSKNCNRKAKLNKNWNTWTAMCNKLVRD